MGSSAVPPNGNTIINNFFWQIQINKFNTRAKKVLKENSWDSETNIVVVFFTWEGNESYSEIELERG